MEDHDSPSAQIRVDALPAAYRAAVEEGKRMGLSAAELSDVFNRHFGAECLQCGIQVTGEELGQLALASPHDPPTDPRLARLLQGYCARKDCDSYYYRLVFQAHPKVDWNRVARATSGTPAPAPAATPTSGDRPGRFWFLEDPRVRRVGIGIAILLVLLVLRHFALGGRVPFLHRSPKYTVDPASVTDPSLGKPARNPIPRR